jgi:hypothetical protein
MSEHADRHHEGADGSTPEADDYTVTTPRGIHELGISERTVIVAALVACIVLAVVHGIVSTAVGSLPGFGPEQPPINYPVPR